jgi:hypothetical protein
MAAHELGGFLDSLARRHSTYLVGAPGHWAGAAHHRTVAWSSVCAAGPTWLVGSACPRGRARADPPAARARASAESSSLQRRVAGPRDCPCFVEAGLLKAQSRPPSAPAIGDRQGADDRGQETLRRMKAGLRTGPEATGCGVPVVMESRSFGLVAPPSRPRSGSRITACICAVAATERFRIGRVAIPGPFRSLRSERECGRCRRRPPSSSYLRAGSQRSVHRRGEEHARSGQWVARIYAMWQMY